MEEWELYGIKAVIVDIGLHKINKLKTAQPNRNILNKHVYKNYYEHLTTSFSLVLAKG